MGLLKKHPTVFLGLGITVLFLVFGFMRVGFFDTLELKFYDVRMALRSDTEAASDIVMVDIDDDTIEKLGRWPWPRRLIAEGLRKINAGAPRAIGLNFILSEPEQSPGLKAMEALEEKFAASFASDTDPAAAGFLQSMRDARIHLDSDRILGEAMGASGKVILPIFFKYTGLSDESAEAPNEKLKTHSLANVSDPLGIGTFPADDVTLPIEPFFSEAKGIGHINLAFDTDGTARRERLLYQFKGLYVPAYSLRLAAAYLNVPLSGIQAELGETVAFGGIEIPTTLYSEMLVSFKGARGSFKRFSYFDVINDKIPLSVFKNKLVLVSPSASGIMNPIPTPTDASMPLGEFTANAVWAILNQSFVQAPGWGSGGELLLILILGLVITFVLPRLKAMTAGIVFWVLLAVLVGGSTYLFVAQGQWVTVTYPLLQLVAGYIGVLSIKYFVTEAGKEKVEGESAETNRMLGLSFQNQGMLDMAYDKFRRVPVDKEMKDILYNLALDYERKRQFNKAASVFEYIEENDAKFKDVAERKKKLVQASETMVFGEGPFGGGGGDGLLATGTGTKPTLGRYEIEKQLGKGAMGIVYLGKDPRINRTTAIKTFRFEEDLDAEDTQKLKEKFFREAESAGTLSHPNIVTIYDAGDEQDLAYIAMEYLEGEDLEKYTKKANLLPMRKVIGYMGDIADGLDYAHERGIVHRDIKPANIMLLKSGVVKITDFGIARITATSQTQTGVVKGTPYYMSPEQFSGERVDGRSDIFSMGTMMFQMLTGKLPFTADSPPALMHAIMNKPHPDPRQFNPKIVKPLVGILNKAMQKDKEARYQRAGHMAAHLRELGKRIDIAMANKKGGA
ncbi:MAG: CHASE2 domain-containing protein [Desulfobacterales bacterium]|nr:CHASE2 domain-containing protein [Desulfobacterales bacterium]